MSGRVLLLPTLLGESQAARVLPQATIDAARNTRHFLAENARSARAFLKAIGHPRPVAELSIVEIGHYPADDAIDVWLAPAREQPVDIAIVSEAGCPGIADPGANIVARAHALGLRVVPLVGPSAPLLLLMAAGMTGQRFRFVGYLPQEAGQCLQAIRAMEADSRRGETQVFIETPYRNQRLLRTLLESLQPTTRLAIGIELTSDNEELRSMSVGEWRRLAPNRRPIVDKRPAVFAVLAASHSGRGR